MGKAARFILGAWVILIAHVFLMLLWVEGLQLPELNGGYVRVYIGVIIGSLVIGTPILAEAVKAQNLKRVFEKIFGETTPNTAPTVKREAHERIACFSSWLKTQIDADAALMSPKMAT